jgi:ribosomal 50S subunit-recycling heat shock protein
MIMIGERMDKWLGAARFFKTRSLAARACELGRIESTGQGAKAAREVRVSDPGTANVVENRKWGSRKIQTVSGK